MTWMNCFGGSAFIPIILVLNTGTCFIVSYFIAYGDGHIFPIWPYISDTGARSPESCYFGQLLNMSAMLAIIFGFLRYQMLESYFEQALIISTRLRVINAIAFIMMVMAGFGMSMVANFQETHVGVLHYTGAALTFGMGGLYILAESYLAVRVQPVFTSHAVPSVRAILGVTSLLSIIMTVVGSQISYSIWDGSTDNEEFHWSSDDPGYAWHLVATGCEWFSGICFLTFFLTMIPEFACFAPSIRINLNLQLMNYDNLEGGAVQA